MKRLWDALGKLERHLAEVRWEARDIIGELEAQRDDALERVRQVETRCAELSVERLETRREAVQVEAELARAKREVDEENAELYRVMTTVNNILFEALYE